MIYFFYNKECNLNGILPDYKDEFEYRLNRALFLIIW